VTVRGYTLGIDWSAHGNFTETGEDCTSRVQKSELSITIGRDSNQTSDHSTSGELNAGLNNRDRVLSPENTASPLYGKVLPGRKVQFTATAGTSVYTLFSGPIDGLTIDTNDAARTFALKALDGWGKPGNEQLSTPLYQGVRTGDCINLILDAIGWTGPRDIDPGASVLPYWWAEGTDAASAVDDLVAAEGSPAIAYVQGGTFVFRDRHHRMLRPRSVTSQALFTHVIPAGSGPGNDIKIEKATFDYDHGLSNISNAVSWAVPVRELSNPAEVWSSDDPISLAAGESTVVAATGSDPFINASLAITTLSGTVTGTLDRTSGATVTIFLTAVTASIVSRIAVTANQATVTRTVKVSAQDPSSIGTYGKTSWTGGVPSFITPYDAQAIANRVVAVNASNRPRVTFTVAHVWSNTTYMAEVLSLAISDRITVRNDALGLNADFAVERLVHTITNLNVHQVQIGAQICDPVQPANLLTFDTAGKGFNQGLFGVVGIDSAASVFQFDTAGHGFNDGVYAT